MGDLILTSTGIKNSSFLLFVGDFAFYFLCLSASWLVYLICWSILRGFLLFHCLCGHCLIVYPRHALFLNSSIRCSEFPNNRKHGDCQTCLLLSETAKCRYCLMLISKEVGSVVECLPKDWKVCGSSLYQGILLWRWALHLHLAPAVHINIMLLRPVKWGAEHAKKA